jgi:hypothetical protein
MRTDVVGQGAAVYPAGAQKFVFMAVFFSTDIALRKLYIKRGFHPPFWMNELHAENCGTIGALSVHDQLVLFFLVHRRVNQLHIDHAFSFLTLHCFEHRPRHGQSHRRSRGCSPRVRYHPLRNQYHLQDRERQGQLCAAADEAGSGLWTESVRGW